METFLKSHTISKTFVISLALICWGVALVNGAAGYNYSAAHTVTAFSTSSISHINNSFQIKNINNNTYEICFKNQNTLKTNALYTKVFNDLKLCDNNIKLINFHHTKGYTDYYLYSPQLCKSNNINNLPTGSNIHIAITDLHKIYIGIPSIDYDF